MNPIKCEHCGEMIFPLTPHVCSSKRTQHEGEVEVLSQDLFENLADQFDISLSLHPKVVRFEVFKSVLAGALASDLCEADIINKAERLADMAVKALCEEDDDEE